jgi:hypothetical protein
MAVVVMHRIALSFTPFSSNNHFKIINFTHLTKFFPQEFFEKREKRADRKKGAVEFAI